MHDDRSVLRRLLLGGDAFDVRTNKMIQAATIADLPHGLYNLIPNYGVTAYSGP